MKRFLLTNLLIALFFSGCFGFLNKKKYEPVTSGELFENDEISIRYPKNWTLVKPEELGNENIIIAFQNQQKTKDFLANVNVTTEENPKITNSKDFAEALLNGYKEKLPYFQETKREELILVNRGKEDQTFLVTFEAKQNVAETPIMRFQQTYLVNEKTAYILTGTYPKEEQEEVVKKITLMLKSFQVK